MQVDGLVKVSIYNLHGGKIVEIVKEHLTAGETYEAEWDGRDRKGRLVAPGIYLVVCRAGGVVTTRKVLVVR